MKKSIQDIRQKHESRAEKAVEKRLRKSTGHAWQVDIYNAVTPTFTDQSRHLTISFVSSVEQWWLSFRHGNQATRVRIHGDPVASPSALKEAMKKLDGMIAKKAKIDVNRAFSARCAAKHRAERKRKKAKVEK